ncbi:restriction endonuclease subunit S [Vibrio salilacus]|uniref:restriction endonuclease subunit S n=1 Tax=Vibrio salilacus TaxID=1323749 RepID=UPI000C2A9118|nr:restriction endonuclease subunit S [Vibrio salilacus]
MSKEWKNGRIGDLISSFESGVSVNGEDREPSDNEYAVLKVSSVTYGHFNPKASKPISGKELDRAKCTPRAGQIIISRASGTSAHVGASTYVYENYPMRFLSDKLWQTVPNPNVGTNMKWLSYCLASPKIRSQILGFATGTNIKNITKKEFLWIPIQIPPIQEQNKIAEMLDLWDDAIEKTEALIAAKEKQFEWLRSHLISSSRTNQTLKFGDFLTESRIPDTTQDPERRLTVRLHLKGVSVRDYRGTESTDATKYFHRKSGQLIYGKQNVFRGSIGIVPSHLDGYSSSQDIPAFDIADNVNSKWLYWYLSRPSFYSWLENFSAGSGSKRLHPKELFKISVDLPTLEDQKRISDSLNLADKEIRLLKKTLEQYRSQKRGLMQKLLTGEWQVTSAQVGAEGELQDRTKENVA